MKLRRLAIFCILLIFITPVLPIKAQPSNHIFSAQTTKKVQNSSSQDGRNITNALSILSGNVFCRELEAHETIYFCTPWQQNISFDIFSNTPQMLSCFLLSDIGKTLDCQKQIKNNKITIFFHDSAANKGQYIFIKITNDKDTDQEFQIKLYNTSQNFEQTEKPKFTPKQKQTAKPKNNNPTLKCTTKPENTPSIPKRITKQTTPPKQTIKPKYTTGPDNIPTKPKQNTKPKNIPPISKQTTKPKNTPSISKQTAKPKDTKTPFPNTTFSNPSQSPKSIATPSHPANQIPPLEEHFLELRINTSYQLTVNNSNPIIWSSTNPEIVSVEHGKLEVHKNGTAIIYCHYPNTERGSSCFIFSR